ncbi:MAG: transcription antitermination factor NusB [Planctomycetia bacterium]|nr:transcription antitermination factor NusB [Planctomycetia bacterium]
MEKTEHKGRFQYYSFARRVAFQLLYQEDLNPGTSTDINEDFISSELRGLCKKSESDEKSEQDPLTAKKEEYAELPINEDIEADSPVSPKDFRKLIRFVKELVEGTLAHRDQIDQIIGNVAEHWSVSRMAKTDRNIIRLAVFEMIRKKTPKAVVIHEALSLGYQFGTGNSSAFMNGILDKIDLSIDWDNLRNE